MERRCYNVRFSNGLLLQSIYVFRDPTNDLDELENLIEQGNGSLLDRIESAANQLFHDEWEWAHSCPTYVIRVKNQD